jgi:hypothetical protein
MNYNFYYINNINIILLKKNAKTIQTQCHRV